MKLVFLCLTVLLAIASPCLAQTINDGPVLASDDFARFTASANDLGALPGSENAWAKRIPSLEDQPMEQLIRGMDGHVMIGYKSGSNPHDTGIWVREFAVADASVSVAVGPSRMPRPMDVMVNYRAQDEASAAGGMQANAYHVEIAADWSGSRDINLRYGPELVATADVGEQNDPKAIYRIKASFAGDYHVVSLDGKKVIEYWESEPGRSGPGHVGLGAYYSIADFDDFEVREASLDLSDRPDDAAPGQMRPLIFQGRPFFVIGSFDPPREDDIDNWLQAGFNTALHGVMQPGKPEQEQMEHLRGVADWSARYGAAAVYYPLIYPYSTVDGKATVTLPEEIAPKSEELRRMLTVTAEHPQTLGYWTFDEPENHVYKAYGDWGQKKDVGLAEWMAEGLKWTYDVVKQGDPDAYVMPTIAWWTTYEGLAPLYDVNVPNTYPCGINDPTLRAPMYHVVYDAAMAADAVRATGRYSFVFMPPMFDILEGGRPASRSEYRYCCFAPLTQGAMGSLGWRLGRCSKLYRDTVIYPVTRDLHRLVPWLLGEWCDEKVSSDHDTATAEYLTKLPVRIKLVPGEEDAEEVEVPGVPDCSYMLRRRPSNTYLLLAVSNRMEPLTVTFTLKDIPGLPETATDSIEFARIPITDGKITEDFEPYGVRAWIIEPK